MQSITTLEIELVYMPEAMEGHSMIATEAELLQRLRDMYWRAATREVCNMLLFFNEVFQAPESVRNALNLRITMEELEAQNFKKMFDLWSELATSYTRWRLTSHRRSWCTRPFEKFAV